MTLRTPRLDLIPATAPLVQAEMRGVGALERMLGAPVGVGWPPDLCSVDTLEWALEQIARDPRFERWGMHYLLFRHADEGARAIGVAGFHGPPAGGTVEIGYSLLDRYRGQGLGREAVSALVEHALAQRSVRVVVAHTPADAEHSIALLEAVGFAFDAKVEQEGRAFVRYLRFAPSRAR
ncbi:GNAT family N-acetyltransferase [Gaopeijia maritima]|uniref:GNAT family N-acetyltransferase n=1 Tax=Gaopeijia maritima TaxID=3119007 RepID=UPI003286C51F